MNEAKYQANKRYNEKTYDQIVVKVRKDAEITTDVIRRYAESKGVSVNALIRDTLERRMLNDPDFVI